MHTIHSISSSALPQVAGYTLQAQLYKGARTAVYRAVANDSRRSVVIKLLSQAYPSFSELTHFRNQYAITQSLNMPSVVRPLALEPWQNGYALVMEDFGGVSLHQFVTEQPLAPAGTAQTDQKALTVIETLAIALQLSEILSELSQHQIVHKDIKPANILIRPDSRQIQLIDFSIATRLPKETQSIQNPNVLEGSLAYLAPEQTGRMNRGIDYRTDFYGLGVTLYELLTGKLPFSSTDALELVHCHMAKAPAAPHEANPDIPPMVSQLVLKLMAKNAEDRYQSAAGLNHDVTRCLHSLKDDGEIVAFNLGDRDVSDRFLIPEKLYGRESEVNTLLAAFDRAASGQAEMMLVAGFSGIGKTAVVKEVLKPITQQQGYFIQGKFDQFNRNIPLSAFVQAIRNLISQVLSESDQHLTQWRTKVLAAVGENAQILIDLVPELEKVLGPQPAVVPLAGSAAQNRFNRIFQQFIQAFPSAEHPLVVFLDDLQWADSASLALLQLLMNNARNLLFLGAYRDNEVSAGHPFMLTVDELEKTNVTVNTLTLPPLTEPDINRMVADTLKCSREVAHPLTTWVQAQTKGNPFFTTQFLKRLHQEGYLSFAYAEGAWQCDMTAVRSLAITDSVISLMAAQLQKLPEQTQAVITLSACIGAQFDLSTLAIALSKTLAETVDALWPALQEGLILSVTDVYKFYQSEQVEDRSITTADAGYRFLHDRVQQAAYSLLSTEQKTERHLFIGQRLLAQAKVPQPHTPEKNDLDNPDNRDFLRALLKEDRLFEITHHLNLGSALLKTDQQRIDLAELNLTTGRKAKTAAAYATALGCCQKGITLLPAEAWQSQYLLTRSLYEAAAEAAYLSAEFDQMMHMIQAVQANAKDTLDQIKVYEVQIQAYMAQGKLSEAIAYGLEILDQLGVHLPADPVPSDIDAAINRTFQTLAGRHPSELIDLPLMRDAEKLGALTILSRVGPCAYQAAPMLLPLTVMEQVNLSMAYGNAPLSASSYSFWGLILCGVLGNIEMGYQFGQLALALVDKLDAIAVRAEALFVVNADVLHYQEHVSTTLPGLQEAYTVGLETGNFEFAALSSHIYAYHAYANGNTLKRLEKRISHYTVQLQQNKQQNAVTLTQSLHQAIKNLLGLNEQPALLVGDSYDRDVMLSQHEQNNNTTAIFYFYYNEMILGYLLEDFSQAVDRAQCAENYIQGVTGNLVVPLFYFYDALSQLARCIALLDTADRSPETAESAAQKQALITRAEESQQKIANWATHAPMNYQHKYQLIEAERLQALGDNKAAMDFYDDAIAGAKVNHYVQDEAIAYERAAQFYSRWGKQKVAAGYMQEAYYCYARWGAAAKVKDLERRYPDLLGPILQTAKASINPFETILAPTQSVKKSTHATRTTPHLNESLDFAAVMQASQVLSQTIDLDDLLNQLTQIILKQSGGDRCALILADAEGVLYQEAIATPDHTDQTRSLLSHNPDLPVKLLNYVKNTQKAVVIDDLSTELPIMDSYLKQVQPKSLICLPLLSKGQLIGLLYLQNKSVSGTFTQDRILALTFLSAQAAVSLENARLYQQSQFYAQQLEHSQLQTVQAEKMASLGNLVAGVAHEINNPIGFLNGSVRNAQAYLNDLLEHISLYQATYPDPEILIEDSAEEIDLEFVTEDFPKLLKAMTAANDRIKAISTSLRTFSRADTEHKISADLQEGLDSTLLILKYRLKPNEQRPAIRVVKNYSKLPVVMCFPGQLNQVFMNLLANAIDVFDEAAQQSSFRELDAARVNGTPQTITVTTRLGSEPNTVEICIRDNGQGMPDAVKSRIFDHLYTTKGVGKGTGLGLAIAKQIVTEVHGGQLTVDSTPSEGTEFCIRLPV